MVAERLRGGCQDLELDPLTVSIGAATVHPGDDDVSLIGRADEALYASKRAGRNRVTHAATLERASDDGGAQRSG